VENGRVEATGNIGKFQVRFPSKKTLRQKLTYQEFMSPCSKKHLSGSEERRTEQKGKLNCDGIATSLIRSYGGGLELK
jgi:hypothetical protein